MTLSLSSSMNRQAVRTRPAPTPVKIVRRTQISAHFWELIPQSLNANPNMGGKIAVGGSSVSTLKGEGDTSRGGKLQARLTARVVKVLDNGNLLIEGRRQLTLNAEDQFIVITGVIRSEDIMADNWVLSSNMADARIVYTGSGILADKQHPGWMTRVLDWGWPF